MDYYWMRLKKNYLNNGALLADIKIAKQNGKLTNELATKFVLLTDRISRKYNFCDYSFLEDMKATALLGLVRNWDKFDCDKSNNPFSYFTQCITNSFKHELNLEKHQRNVVDKLMISSGLNPSNNYASQDD